MLISTYQERQTRNREKNKTTAELPERRNLQRFQNADAAIWFPGS